MIAAIANQGHALLGQLCCASLWGTGGVMEGESDKRRPFAGRMIVSVRTAELRGVASYGRLWPILSRFAAMYLALCSWIGPMMGT